MTDTSPALAAIKIPAEAVGPLALGVGALLVLTIGGAGLIDWKRKHPGPARTLGTVLGAIASIGAIAFVAQALPRTESRDLLQAVYAAVAAGLAGAMWALAGRRGIGAAIAGVVALLLIGKPFVHPVVSDWGSGVYVLPWDSETHLFYILPGAALAIVAIYLAASRRAT